MKRFFVLYSVFLISGCPGPGDRMPETVYADVKLKDNSPCVLYPAKLGDRITSIQIYNEMDEPFRKLFDDSPFQPAYGQCLPMFGYHFNPGKSYVIYYGLDNDSAERQKLIQADFAIDNESKVINKEHGDKNIP